MKRSTIGSACGATFARDCRSASLISTVSKQRQPDLDPWRWGSRPVRILNLRLSGCPSSGATALSHQPTLPRCHWSLPSSASSVSASSVSTTLMHISLSVAKTSSIWSEVNASEERTALIWS
jgi:hypothetical protein